MSSPIALDHAQPDLMRHLAGLDDAGLDQLGFGVIGFGKEFEAPRHPLQRLRTTRLRAGP